MVIESSEEIPSLHTTMENIIAVVQPDKLRERIVELNEKAATSDLWDDPSAAQAVTNVFSHHQSELDHITQMSECTDDPKTMVDMAAEDPDEDADILAETEADLEKLHKDLDDLEIYTLLDGEHNECNAAITIRSGADGVDAADFAKILLCMHLRWAERHGYPTRVMNTSYAEETGLKSATFEVQAPYAYDTLSVEAGTHRLTRISPFNNQGRRQTSFAIVEVIPLIRTTDHIEIPGSELKVGVFRSSGPGGQSVNMTNLAVCMTYIPTGIAVSMQDEKSQIQNRAAALRVLQSRLLALRYEGEQAKKKELTGDIKALWGDQMRSYVLRPYQVVKDLCIEYEFSNPQSVSDGDVDGFIDAGIRWRKNEQKAAQN